MYRAAEGENFELARYYRDLIRTVERVQAEQQVASAESEDVDVWGLYEEGGDVAVQLFVLRDGNVVDRRELFWEKIGEYQPSYFLGEVVQRYYQDNLFIPPEILLPFEIEDAELLAEWLSRQRDRKVALRVPRRGKGADRVELANRNARPSHDWRFRRSQHDRMQSAACRL